MENNKPYKVIEYDESYYEHLLLENIGNIKTGLLYYIRKVKELENKNEVNKKMYENRVEEYLELQNKIKKQEKIIDLMAEDLTTPIHNKEWIKKQYEKRYENAKN